MPDPDLFELFVRPLDRLHVRYYVSGSVAAMLYGEPRVTHDIDLVVALVADSLHGLAEAFRQPEFYIPPPDLILVEMHREQRGHFNIIHADSGLKADFYLAGRDELHAWAFRRTREYPIGGATIRVAPPEYVILRKMEYFREGGSEKHLRDIRSMLAVSGELIDRPELEEWVRRRGLGEVWAKCRG